jgi:ABC-type amino acid transport substrate-binding protein
VQSTGKVIDTQAILEDLPEIADVVSPSAEISSTSKSLKRAAPASSKTRSSSPEINASANTFLDKVKANGELAGLYKKWMQQDLPTFPDSVPDVPFTVK